MAIIPYRSIWDIDKWFDDDDWMALPAIRQPRMQMPRMDIYDEDNNIVVEAEIPGLDPKNVDARITDNVLVIEGRAREEETSGQPGGIRQGQSSETRAQGGQQAQRQSGLYQEDISRPQGAQLQGTEQSRQASATGKAGDIVGEKRPGRNYYRHEIRREYFRRVIQLPDDVMSDKAKATFRNGILRVTIPRAGQKKEEERTRKLEIQS